MDILDATRNLLAVRRFHDRPLPEDVVRRIVEAGWLTGSSRNAQPWHLVVAQDWERLQSLGTALEPSVHRPGVAGDCCRKGLAPLAEAIPPHAFATETVGSLVRSNCAEHPSRSVLSGSRLDGRHPLVRNF